MTVEGNCFAGLQAADEAAHANTVVIGDPRIAGEFGAQRGKRRAADV